MKYNAKDANQCIPAGTYDASIKYVTEEDQNGKALESRKGEAMQKVVFEVYTPAGNKTVNQYFTNRSMLWMYKKLAKAIGQEESFKSETFDAKDYLGTNLRLELEVEDTPQYGDQNRIKEFLPKEPATGTGGVLTGTGEGGKLADTDIPF